MPTLTFGSYLEQGYLIEWVKLPALSEEFADKMAGVTDLGIDSFRSVEMDFLLAYPQAIAEDPSLAPFFSLELHELESSMNAKLYKIFNSRPTDLSDKIRVLMKDTYYYIVTIKDEKSEKVQGFITFMTGGSIPEKEYKITILAIDKNNRREGLATLLINSLEKIGVPYKKIFACTRPSNIIAINAYKKWGFIEDQEAMRNPPSHFIKGHWVHLYKSKLKNDATFDSEKNI